MTFLYVFGYSQLGQNLKVLSQASHKHEFAPVKIFLLFNFLFFYFKKFMLVHGHVHRDYRHRLLLLNSAHANETRQTDGVHHCAH